MTITWGACQSDDFNLRQAYNYVKEYGPQKIGGQTTLTVETGAKEGMDPGNSVQEDFEKPANVKLDNILKKEAFLRGQILSGSRCEIDLDHDGRTDTVYSIEKEEESTDPRTGIVSKININYYYFDLGGNGPGIDLVYRRKQEIKTIPFKEPTNPLPKPKLEIERNPRNFIKANREENRSA
ncbi:MAG: hypothetical protein WCV91_01890 [Candidatus Margulisiibacteriota bacterium]|jgi:hypothetical protein